METVVHRSQPGHGVALQSEGQPGPIYGDAAHVSIAGESRGPQKASHFGALPSAFYGAAAIVASRRGRESRRAEDPGSRHLYLRERGELERVGATAAVFEEAEAASRSGPSRAHGHPASIARRRKRKDRRPPDAGSSWTTSPTSLTAGTKRHGPMVPLRRGCSKAPTGTKCSGGSPPERFVALAGRSSRNGGANRLPADQGPDDPCVTLGLVGPGAAAGRHRPGRQHRVDASRECRAKRRRFYLVEDGGNGRRPDHARGHPGAGGRCASRTEYRTNRNIRFAGL